MPSTYQPGDEPVPGMRLLKFLGQGGIGAVWKASAPGGTEVALKFINLSAARGVKEFSSLRIMKRIRHPNLVPLIAYWMRDTKGQLVEQDTADVEELKRLVTPISPLQATVDLDEVATARPVELIVAMGLGDRDLAYRLHECQQSGLAGIPVAELLDYMTEAAKAIDFLNAPRHDSGDGLVGIQHCDIKPFNIVLVGDAVQVCDFGLAQIVGDIRSSSTSSGTIAYVAPELLTTNEPSCATDQYSLAITYFELRTGRLPYRSDVFAEVMKSVMCGDLDFAELAESERAVIRQATSLDPALRFASAGEMVRALRQAVDTSTGKPQPGGSELRVTSDTRLQQTVPFNDEESSAAPAHCVDHASWPWLRTLLVGLIAATITWWILERPPASPLSEPLQQAQQQIAVQNYAAAIPLLDTLIAADGIEAAEAWLLRGTCYLELGNNAQAEADLSEAIRRREEDARAYSRRAAVRLKANNKQAAIEDYSKALEIAPAAIDYHMRGVAYGSLEDYSAAFDDFSNALKYGASNAAEIYHARGFIAERLGRPEVFDRDLRAHQMLQAHAEATTDDAWLAKLAETLGVPQQETDALVERALQLADSICQDSQYRQAVQLDLLAQLHAQRGDFAAAIKYGSQACEYAQGTERAGYEQRLLLYHQAKPYRRSSK